MVTVAIIASVLALLGVAGAFIVLAGVANEFARLRWRMDEQQEAINEIEADLSDLDFSATATNSMATAALNGARMQ